MSDKVFIVCVDIGRFTEHLSGSKIVRCFGCDVEMWLSPATERRPESKGAKCICPKCATAFAVEQLMEKPEGLKIFELNQDQYREIDAHFNTKGKYNS